MKRYDIIAIIDGHDAEGDIPELQVSEDSTGEWVKFDEVEALHTLLRELFSVDTPGGDYGRWLYIYRRLQHEVVS